MARPACGDRQVHGQGPQGAVFMEAVFVSNLRRSIILAGLAGILHSSLVPPVVQTAAGVCRYTQFMLRAWPFTKEYAVAQADLPALISEYGIILSLGAMMWLLAGWWEEQAGKP